MTIKITALALVLALPVHASVPPGAEMPVGVQWQDDTLSIDVEDANLGQLLDLISEQTGLQVEFNDANAKQRLVSARLDALPLEDALARLVRENYTFNFRSGVQGGSELVGITVGDKTGEKDTVEQTTINRIQIAYGDAEHQVGAINDGKGVKIGPTSFQADAAGNTYILDTVNNRIQSYDPSGEHRFSRPLQGLAADDLVITEEGGALVYDRDGQLYHYDHNGELIASLVMDENRWHTRGAMTLTGDALYVMVNGVGDVPLARYQDGQWHAVGSASGQEEIIPPGRVGPLSGRRFVEALDAASATASLQVKQGDTSFSSQIPVNDVLSVSFLGEDRDGNYYAQTESLDSGKVRLQVSKFDGNGDHLGSVQIDNGDYFYWSHRLLSVSEDGGIHQMMAGQEQLQLTAITFPPSRASQKN